MSRKHIFKRIGAGILCVISGLCFMGESALAAKIWPVSFSESMLERPNAWAADTVDLSVPEFADTVEELAYGIDAALCCAEGKEGEMVYFSLGDALLKEALSNPEGLVLRTLQISLLGHNFCSRYNDSRLSEGELGFWIEMPEEYATRVSGSEARLSAMNYAFYRNSLQKDKRDLRWIDLPIFSQDLPWLSVNNSEQLLFAVQNGYLPWCEPGSSASVMLQKCLEILSWITDDSMSETACYSAIYQYVLLSNQYDYDTLLDIRQRGMDHRVFFLEGALQDGKAVCDGLCKELVLLSRLAGLKAYHVGASGAESGHAYVYVQVDGAWYLSCPTYGSNKYTRKDGREQDYHTNNYMMTDFDTNMEGWPYDAEALEDIEVQLKETEPFDYWMETSVVIGENTYSFHPETVEDAMTLLEDARKLYEELQIPVELELCGKVSVLREAYNRMKQQFEDLVYLSGGTFEQQRLQIYVFGG